MFFETFKFKIFIIYIKVMWELSLPTQISRLRHCMRLYFFMVFSCKYTYKHNLVYITTKVKSRKSTNSGCSGGNN